MQQAPSDPENFELQEQLVAYLDGELDAPTVEQIEALIRTDTDVREQLRKLEQSWDILDVLPQSEAPKDFTNSTIAMVAVRARDDIALDRAVARRRNWTRTLLNIAGVLLCAAIGYGAVSALPHPNDLLEADLPLFERLDEYRQIDNVEFLESLQESDLFPAEEAPDHG